MRSLGLRGLPVTKSWIKAVILLSLRRLLLTNQHFCVSRFLEKNYAYKGLGKVRDVFDDGKHPEKIGEDFGNRACKIWYR